MIREIDFLQFEKKFNFMKKNCLDEEKNTIWISPKKSWSF